MDDRAARSEREGDNIYRGTVKRMRGGKAGGQGEACFFAA